jgi:hypothetical protein
MQEETNKTRPPRLKSHSPKIIIHVYCCSAGSTLRNQNNCRSVVTYTRKLILQYEILSFRVTEEIYCGGNWTMTPCILVGMAYNSNMHPA